MAAGRQPTGARGEVADAGRRAALARLGIAATVAYAAPVILRIDRSWAVVPTPPPPPPGALGTDGMDPPDPFDGPTSE